MLMLRGLFHRNFNEPFSSWFVAHELVQYFEALNKLIKPLAAALRIAWQIPGMTNEAGINGLASWP